MLKFDKRFARQYCYGLPPRFLLASAYSSIARRFSGPNVTHSNSGRRPEGRHREGTAGSPAGGLRPSCFSHEPRRSSPSLAREGSGGFGSLVAVRLARTLDSLVRVSRRVGTPTL